MTFDIIVAYYNNENFYKLLNLFDSHNFDYKAIIYNKSSNELHIEMDVKISNFNLNNIGRESETYLNHIIKNYDNLAEYTLFIQDDTNNHINNYNNFIEFCKKVINDKIQFQLYPCSWRENGYINTRTINNGICDLHTLASNNSIKKCCEDNDIYLPEQYTTFTCAFFICHKNIILKHKKDFYIKLRNWLLTDEKNGFVLEHIWKILFCI